MAEHGIQFWTTHSLDKVFPDSEVPPGARRDICLKAARNETEDAQVVIRVPRGTEISRASYRLTPLVGPVPSLSAGCTAGGVEGPDGVQIPPAPSTSLRTECLSAHWQWFIYVTHNPPANRDPATYLRKAPAFFPDAFLEQTEIRIRDEWTQPLWFSVRVPSDAVPGRYTGGLWLELQVRDGDLIEIEVPVSLDVWPFALPQRFHLHHTEWFWPEGIARYYHVEPWSEGHWRWIEKVARDMARHKQDMILTRFIPWGGRKARTHSLVYMVRRSDGTFQFDFSRLDRWIETFKAAGVEWIEGGHVARRIGGWHSPIGFNRFPVYDDGANPIPTDRESMSEEEFEPFVEALLKGVYAHLKERGWHRQYVQHIADEPAPENAESWSRISSLVKEWLPDVPRIDAVMAEGLEGLVELRVPQIQEITGPSTLREPEQLWSYVCLAPQGIYPNRFLDYASIRNRIIFWLSWTLDLKGFLHWGYNAWRAWQGVPVPIDISPWTDATGGSIYCQDRNPLPAGDPHIVYPGKETICSSIRWEVIRKGFEDYEYLWLLEDLARSAPEGPAKRRAEELLERVRSEIAPDPATHTRDDALLLSTREEIGQTISELWQG